MTDHRHIFPHTREAIRAWAAWRTGKGASRAAFGKARGKGPSPRDCVRVGQVIHALSLTRSQVGTLLQVAHGTVRRTEDSRTLALVRRVERAFRTLDMVRPAARPFVRRRAPWEAIADDGSTHVVETTYCVDLS